MTVQHSIMPREALSRLRLAAWRWTAGLAMVCIANVSVAQPTQPDPQMQGVLDALRDLKARPVHSLSVMEARTQANAADAARTVRRARNISFLPEAEVETRDLAIPTPAGALPARVYAPDASGPLPMVLYFHGGGWVIGDLNSYDETPRALTLGTGAIVLSIDYRHAPESKFPAAHDDAWNTYLWLLDNAATIGGDPKRIAVAGEGAGANLAANVALMAKEKNRPLPVYQLLVTPIAGSDTTTPSYQENAETRPLGGADMTWFTGHVLSSREQDADPRINLIGRNDLAGLPPATVVTAELDPLRSEGQTYAEMMKSAGVAVNLVAVTGVTHEFFGMGLVIDKAKSAIEAANTDLLKALATSQKQQGPVQ